MSEILFETHPACIIYHTRVTKPAIYTVRSAGFFFRMSASIMHDKQTTIQYTTIAACWIAYNYNFQPASYFSFGKRIPCNAYVHSTTLKYIHRIQINTISTEHFGKTPGTRVYVNAPWVPGVDSWDRRRRAEAAWLCRRFPRTESTRCWREPFSACRRASRWRRPLCDPRIRPEQARDLSTADRRLCVQK